MTQFINELAKLEHALLVLATDHGMYPYYVDEWKYDQITHPAGWVITRAHSGHHCDQCSRTMWSGRESRRDPEPRPTLREAVQDAVVKLAVSTTAGLTQAEQTASQLRERHKQATRLLSLLGADFFHVDSLEAR